jgi:hypothetical protein
MMKNRTLVNFAVGLALAVGATSGCGSATSASGGMSRMKGLSMLFTKVSSDIGREPANEQEFKQGIVNSGIPLERLSVTSVDELFISDRDGQPLIVVYGVRPKGSDVIIYEQTGVDGKRQIAHRIGTIEEIDEAKFKELVPSPPASQ